MANTNAKLNRAKKVKNDEFYTRYEDIEKELRHYVDFFKGKVIYCPCDNPYYSNFVRWFVDNFNEIGIKELIATCYTDRKYKVSFMDDILGEQEPQNPILEKAYKFVVSSVEAADTFEQTLEKNKPTELKGNGDFRSDECVEVMRTADIVVTNPPFSIFRDFFDLLMREYKDFLILGSYGATSYMEIFPYIRHGIVGGGYTNGTKRFNTLNDKSTGIVKVFWFTTIFDKETPCNIQLTKPFSVENYPKYQNYDAIEVKSLSDVPCDYQGVMGVPLTIFGIRNITEMFDFIGVRFDLRIDGKKKYTRILIKRRNNNVT